MGNQPNSELPKGISKMTAQVNAENSVPTQNEENSVTENETPNSETPTPDLNPGNMDPNFYNVMRTQLEGWVNDHNSKAEVIKNKGDRVALKDSLLENPAQTNDNDFVELVNRRNELSDALEAAEKAISEKAEPFIVNALKTSGVDKLQSEADEIAKQAKATINYLSAMGASLDGIPALANRAGRNSTTSGDGRGAGVPKYRNLEVYVDGKRSEQKVNKKQSDGTTKPVLVSNLTYGANAAGVPTDVFREAFIKAQGTSDPGSFKDKVEFEVTDENKNTHSVVVQKIKD